MNRELRTATTWTAPRARPRPLGPLWVFVAASLFFAASVGAGIGLGAWTAGWAGALLGALLAPLLASCALLGWGAIGLGVYLVLPPREDAGAGSTLALLSGCAVLGAALGGPVALGLGAVAAQVGAVAGAVLGSGAGLVLDLALYE